ncbi:hypothetical protein B0T17DRAFT_465849, partial [Bombardia bombarda]
PPPIPKYLFHTTLTVIDQHNETCGSVRTVHILGTHTSLPAARSFALNNALQELNYTPSDFTSYTIHSSPALTFNNHKTSDPSPTDNTLITALTPTGQTFLIGLSTKPNPPTGPSSSAPPLPASESPLTGLHYVVQHKTDYDQAKPDALFQSSEIEGCYVRRADAMQAARELLGGGGGGGHDRSEFVQYDERGSSDDDDSGGEEEGGHWPFGRDVVVRAVGPTGVAYAVMVRTVKGARERFGKR